MVYEHFDLLDLLETQQELEEQEKTILEILSEEKEEEEIQDLERNLSMVREDLHRIEIFDFPQKMWRGFKDNSGGYQARWDSRILPK